MGLPMLPAVNGQSQQHATISALVASSLANFQIKTFSEISFEDGAEKEAVKDSQGQTIGWVVKDSKTEGKIKLLKDEWDDIEEKYDAYPGGMGLVEMQWSLSFGNSIPKLRTKNLIGVMFQKSPMESTREGGALYVDIPLFITRIINNKSGKSFINYTP